MASLASGALDKQLCKFDQNCKIMNLTRSNRFYLTEIRYCILTLWKWKDAKIRQKSRKRGKIVFPRGFQLKTWLDICTFIFAKFILTAMFANTLSKVFFKYIISDTVKHFYTSISHIFISLSHKWVINLRDKILFPQTVPAICQAARNIGVQKSLQGYHTFFLSRWWIRNIL